MFRCCFVKCLLCIKFWFVRLLYFSDNPVCYTYLGKYCICGFSCNLDYVVVLKLYSTFAISLSLLKFVTHLNLDLYLSQMYASFINLFLFISATHLTSLCVPFNASHTRDFFFFFLLFSTQLPVQHSQIQRSDFFTTFLEQWHILFIW